MNTQIFPFIGRAGVLAAGLLLAAGAPARAADKANADAFPNYESYIKVSGQAAAVSGRDSAFQSRTRQPAEGGAGIEDLHILRDVSKDTSLVIDGRALVGVEDYLGSFKLTKNDVGTFEMGYKRFRTFYDGVGGFFPTSNQWMTLAEQELHVDRAKFWVEGTVALPGKPVVTLRYVNELRSGKKDSTIWGSSDLTDLPFNRAPNPINPARKFAPSYIKLGERNQELELIVKHKIGRTNVQLTLLGEEFNNVDTRFVTNYPGEVIPWSIASLATAAQPAAKAAVAPTNWNNQVVIAETEGMKSKTSGAVFEADTPLNDKLTLRVNGHYELVHTTISGSRPLITSVPTSTGVVLVTTNNYSGLTGGTRLKNSVGNIALDWKATKALFVKVAFRAQEEYVRGSSSYNVIAATGSPALTLTTTPRVGWAKLEQDVRTPVLEFRYTGIKDLSIYFSGSQRDLSGVERNSSAYNPTTAAIGTAAIQNVSEDHGNYTLGANWRASQFLTLRGEVFEKGHQDNTRGFETRVGDHYLLDSNYRGFKLTATVKPIAQFGFTTRVVSQRGEMQVAGFLPTYPAYDSLDAKNLMISESIDWNPTPQVYFQLNGTATYNVISTIYPRAGITPATATNNAFDSNKILQNSNNNYVTAGFISGFVVDKKTDAQVRVDYYRADNGDAFLAPYTMPYGVAAKDLTITVGLKRKLSDKWIGHAKVGYFDSVNETTGGRANFHGPLAYVSLERAL